MGHPVFYLSTLQMRERGGRSREEREEEDGLILLEDCGSISNVGPGVPGSGWPSISGARWRRKAALPLSPAGKPPTLQQAQKEDEGWTLYTLEAEAAVSTGCRHLLDLLYCHSESSL